jgi:hypothetical protein
MHEALEAVALCPQSIILCSSGQALRLCKPLVDVKDVPDHAHNKMI